MGHFRLKPGFTLIELLVVISIISLLASIILASLGDARRRAQNSARNSQVMEYVKALMLYKTDKGYFPHGNISFGSDAGQTYDCLGTYTEGNTNVCDFDADGGTQGDKLVVDSSFALKTELSGYISSFPPVGPPVRGEDNGRSGTYTGAVYGCMFSDPARGDFCNENADRMVIYWFLDGEDAVCARPQNVSIYGEELNHATKVCEMVIE